MFNTLPQWESQQYPPEGATAAAGIRSQLGRPALDLLTTLVREAAQNSWDARLDQTDTVKFGLDLRKIGPAHAHAWRSLLLNGGPHNTSHFPLRAALTKPTIRVLAVSDRGTKGLGGPTRADVVTDGPRDFVTFVRNAGEPRDVKLGGGTYGFGKGIFYMLSETHTVLVHTRVEHDGRLQTRLIGIALGDSYTQQAPTGARRFTGRHWWGAPNDDVVEPLLDAEADSAANALGLRPFERNETGTTIYVVDPQIDDTFETSKAVGEYLAETILWQLWPKVLPRSDSQPTMEFEVVVDGQRYDIPNPATTHPISLFVSAYRQSHGDDARILELARPRTTLGRLALNDTFVMSWEPSRAAQSAGFENGLIHHVCLMRAAELVVAYWPGTRPAAEVKGYAGVFRADEDLDDVFAKAEPPTHDAWNANSLPREDGRYVRGVFKRLRDATKEMTGPRVVIGSGTSGVALGAASNYFSDLVRSSTAFGGRSSGFGSTTATDRASVDADGLSARPTPRAGHTNSGARSGGRMNPRHHSPPNERIRIGYVDEPHLTYDGASTVVVQDFRISGGNRVRLEAILSIAVAVDATGRDTDHADPPRVLDWTGPNGSVTREANPVVDCSEGTWRLRVRPPRDTMIVVEVRAEVSS